MLFEADCALHCAVPLAHLAREVPAADSPLSVRPAIAKFYLRVLPLLRHVPSCCSLPPLRPQ